MGRAPVRRVLDHVQSGDLLACKALAIDPNHPAYRHFLANHLSNLIAAAEGTGRSDEAAKAKRELDDLGIPDPRFAAIDARLESIINRTQTPRDATERIELANRAHVRAFYALAARLFAEALASDPNLAADRRAQHAYNAACAAARAGTGKSNDDPQPDDAEKSQLRRQALVWLKAELTAWKPLSKTADPGNNEMAAKALAYWKQDPDLAAIRDEPLLSKLPDPERKEWQALWSEVESRNKGDIAH